MKRLLPLFPTVCRKLSHPLRCLSFPDKIRRRNTRCQGGGGMQATGPGKWMMVLLLSAASQAVAGTEARIVDAAKRGDRSAVRALLKERVDVNVPEPDGTTALHWAAFH